MTGAQVKLRIEREVHDAVRAHRDAADIAKGTKQVCFLAFPICMPRFPHHTVPEGGLEPSGFVGWPNLHSPHLPLVMRDRPPYSSGG